MHETIPNSTSPGVNIHFRHQTRYSYSGPVDFGKHRLVMRPRESYHQRLLAHKITTSPESDLHWSEDIFGNMIATLTFAQQAPELVIASEFTVWQSEPPEGLQSSEGILVSVPAYYGGMEQVATYLYRNAVYPRQVELVRKWVMEQNIIEHFGQEIPLFDNMATAIESKIGYKRREEPGVQSPRETLREDGGSCRDTAVLMMEAARAVGFAARFVSGYLESEVSRVGNGATHAWTEIYLPDRGWMGFDPSIGRKVGLGHVPVGVSYHPRGVMPIAGSFKGHGNSSLGMEVEISSSREVQNEAKPAQNQGGQNQGTQNQVMQSQGMQNQGTQSQGMPKQS